MSSGTRRERHASRCWGCGQPLSRERFPGGHQVYHDESCKERHDRELAAFNERHPEIPAWGRSRVPRPKEGDVVRVVRASDGRLAARFEKGPARKGVREHHGTDVLPIDYYLASGADEDDALAFLEKSYPRAEVLAAGDPRRRRR